MSEIENVNVEEVSFEQMLEDSLVTLHTGDVVKGTVIQVVGEEVSVNLGFKSDGVIPRGEFSRDTTVVLFRQSAAVLLTTSTPTVSLFV